MSSVRVKWLTWVVVLHPTANLLGGDETEELREGIKAAVAQHYQGIVINLSDIGLVNSTGVGVLVELRVSGRRTGTKTACCCAPGTLARRLGPQLTHALKGLVGLPWFDSEEEAVRFCSQR